VPAHAHGVLLVLHGRPEQVVFTPNSDTPYAGGPIDLSSGPMVVEIPPGPIMAMVNDLNQRYVIDMGLPGPDAGKAEGTSSCRRATRASTLRRHDGQRVGSLLRVASVCYGAAVATPAC
jgi:hypothetical protein